MIIQVSMEWAVLRAVVKLGRDGGGSTITQQLAKYMLGQGSHNMFRRGIEKLKEWITAVGWREILRRKKFLHCI